MKAYIIAAALFVTAFLTFGVLIANLSTSPDTKPQQPRPAPNQASHGGSGSSGPAEPSYTAANPTAHGQGTLATAPARAPELPASLSTPLNTGAPPGPSGISSISGPIGISAPPAIPLPPGPPAAAPPSVPIIQPTDLGSAPSPTAGKQHQ